MDADDELFSTDSLEALWKSAKKTNSKAAIGSNKLRKNGKILSEDNIADSNELKHHFELTKLIEKFASGRQKRELPSCNLILRTNLGIRYPNIRSAEDHWLVTKLLMLHSSDIAICPYPIYAIYSLDGDDTKKNKSNEIWLDQRNRLSYIARTWSTLLTTKRHILGMGMEGTVWLQHNQVVKEFYPWTMSDVKVQEIKILLSSDKDIPIPKVTWQKYGGMWRYQTAYNGKTMPGEKIAKKINSSISHKTVSSRCRYS
ncbi:hypothetical protein [Photobacterium kishitanii]|uniref:hypothetical protein n=1 Tax=Photobacterium kishitanii TaxID=318456 RepID=UPI001F3565A4|nr:hypothetical protein [Photobacterium kishitanii]